MQSLPLNSINWWEGSKIFFDWGFGFILSILRLLLLSWPLWITLLTLYVLKVLFSKNTSNKNSESRTEKSGTSNGNIPTKYAQLLHDELKRRGIDSILEYDDGFKKVDLAILPAKIYVEIDGIQHLTNPKQIIKDFKRDYYSEHDGYYTIRIPNEIMKNHFGGIADAIAEVTKIQV